MALGKPNRRRADAAFAKPDVYEYLEERGLAGYFCAGSSKLPRVLLVRLAQVIPDNIFYQE